MENSSHWGHPLSTTKTALCQSLVLGAQLFPADTRVQPHSQTATILPGFPPKEQQTQPLGSWCLLLCLGTPMRWAVLWKDASPRPFPWQEPGLVKTSSPSWNLRITLGQLSHFGGRLCCSLPLAGGEESLGFFTNMGAYAKKGPHPCLPPLLFSVSILSLNLS